jgi:adenine-specific DNA-methyltransferase
LHKGVYQSIDEAFLEELDEIRDSLAKSFKKANPHLESEALTEMTQRSIDRLVFIRFLEDKQIEPDHYVSEFARSKNAWKDFKIASRKLDAKYNGVVFKKHTIDGDNFIEPDDKSFSSICEELAHVNSPYNFDIIPIHILGSIYERFLGKVVVATDKRVRIEEKPEVRKAGGVYYTPQYIVNYIVDNTVGKLIEGKTPKEISKMRFADIACGSGSFLITVFDRLLEHHRKWYQDNTEQAKKDGCILHDGKWVLSLKQKQKILTNNIYGVDLDHQAVEVTQLSLYLKLLEDETTATAQDTWVMFKEQLLPNLNNNIVCGNSLVGTDILDLTLFPSPYQGEGQRERFDELKLKPMNFEDVFPEVMSKGGFDAIVGNPPYLKIEHITELERQYFSKRYKSFFKRYDTYGLFVEKGIDAIKKNGSFGVIIPSTILNNVSFMDLRKYLLDNVVINRITNLGGHVFQNVNNDTLILMCVKTKEEGAKTEVYDVEKYGKKIGSAKLTDHIDLLKFSTPPNFTFELRVAENLLKQINKIQNISTPLSNICFCFQGFVTGSNEAYIIDEATIKNEKLEKQLCYSSVFGNEVGRYKIPEPKYYVLYLTKDDNLLHYPNVSKRLENYRAFLSKKREVKLGRQPWFSLHWPRKKENYLREEKILVQAIRNLSLKRRLIAALDKSKLFADHTLNVIYTDQKEYSIRYILAILNSSLMNYVFSKKYIDINIKGIYLLDIPIKTIDFKNSEEKLQHDNIVKLVDQMLESKKQLANAKTESEKEYLEKKCSIIDKQIDQLVYELYGLTEDEIKIVGGNG